MVRLSGSAANPAPWRSCSRLSGVTVACSPKASAGNRPAVSSLVGSVGSAGAEDDVEAAAEEEPDASSESALPPPHAVRTRQEIPAATTAGGVPKATRVAGMEGNLTGPRRGTAARAITEPDPGAPVRGSDLVLEGAARRRPRAHVLGEHRLVDRVLRVPPEGVRIGEVGDENRV